MSQYAGSRFVQDHVESPESTNQRANPENEGHQERRGARDQGPKLEKDKSQRRTTSKPSSFNQAKPREFRSSGQSAEGSRPKKPSTLDTGRSTHRRPFRFENLEVWHAARFLNRQIYRITRKFPSNEQYGLTSQIRRAAVSISSNVAEGSGRNSDKDFAHFLEQAYGSLMEVASQLFLAIDERFVSQSDVERLFCEIDNLAGKIVALNRSMGVSSSKVKYKGVQRRVTSDQG